VTCGSDTAEPMYRFVGIDDFALRKGQTYGTILIDLERGRVIDLFEGRDGAAVEAWLKAHPGVEVITRDRWSAYANAAAAGSPTATQVADRFHLVKNLRELVERLFEAHAAALDAVLRPATDATAPPPEVLPTVQGPVETRAVTTPPSQRDARFAEVKRLREGGMGVRRIARELGMSVTTVRRYLRRDRRPDGNRGRRRPTRLDGVRDQVDAYIRDGGRNAAELHRRLRARGCATSPASVRRFLNKRLRVAGIARQRADAGQPPKAARPSARQLSFEYVRRAEKRGEEEKARMAAVAGVAGMADELKLVDEFLGMARRTVTTPLADWLTRADQSPNTSMRSFAASIRTDEAAVAAGLTTRWSNGPVEGQVGRLKAIKRSMYGRAGFRLLRARVRAKP
jgi:transposase